MKNSFIWLIAILITSSCNFPRPSQLNFEEVVGTEVAVARTSTAIQANSHTETEVANPTSTILTPQPLNTISATPSLMSTPINFNEIFGMPSWRDEMNSGALWNLAKPNTATPNVTIQVENGVLSMSRSVAYGGKNWWLNYQTLKDFYLEGKFTTKGCTSDDQYGLVFRAPNYTSGFGYYFIVTCDGHFNLMRWDENGAVNLFKWEKSDAIQAGPNKTNSFGVWAKQDLIRLYANGILIKQITDSFLQNKGHFGLFIDPQQTPGFTIEMDEMVFWDNPQN